MRLASSRVGADGENGSSDPGLVPKGWSSAQELAYSQLLSGGVQELPPRTASGEVFWGHPLLWMVVVFVSILALGLSGVLDPDWNAFREVDEMLMLEANGPIFDVVFLTMGINICTFPMAMRVLASLRSFEVAMATMGEFVWVASACSIKLNFGSGYGDRWPQVRDRFVRKFGAALMIPAILLGPALARAKLSYQAVTLEGIRDRTGWSAVDLPWNSAQSIAVGCMDGHPSYRVTLSNGRVYHLLREDGRGLDVVDSVDRALLANGVMKSTDARGWEKCISKWPFASESEQLKVLLRRSQ